MPRQTVRKCSNAWRIPWWVLPCCLLGAAYAASAEEIRYHGIQLDDRHRLVIEQENGLVRVALYTRARAVGGKPLKRTRAYQSAEVGRYGHKEELVRLRSETLKASAPNYLRNPGQRYRITVEGVSVAPEYANTFEVNAGSARKAIFGEFWKLGVRSHGIVREALWNAGPLVLGVLNEAGRIPADVPMSIREGTVGQIRFDEETLQRRSLRRGRSLDPLQDRLPAQALVSPKKTDAKGAG